MTFGDTECDFTELKCINSGISPDQFLNNDNNNNNKQNNNISDINKMNSNNNKNTSTNINNIIILAAFSDKKD